MGFFLLLSLNIFLLLKPLLQFLCDSDIQVLLFFVFRYFRFLPLQSGGSGFLALRYYYRLPNEIQYAEESDFEDGDFVTSKVSGVTSEVKIRAEEKEAIQEVEKAKGNPDKQIQENHIPKIIPKKEKTPFNVEAFAKECNAYVIKQERQEEQENLQH